MTKVHKQVMTKCSIYCSWVTVSLILYWSLNRCETWVFYTVQKNTNREITTTWYYVNSRKHIDSEKIRVPDGIWTHDPPWSSRMLYHWATGDSVVSKGQIAGIDWNRIARLHSHVLVHMNSLCSRAMWFQSIPTIWPLLTRVSSSSVVEHPTRSRRVVGSNPIWDSDFFRL